MLKDQHITINSIKDSAYAKPINKGVSSTISRIERISEFITNVAATIIGGVALSILFFWVKEKLFPLPKVTGRWHFEQITKETAYNPYKNMILRYVAILCREGNKIEGTAEKIYENSSTGERTYAGSDRTRAVITGYIEKNYLGKDYIFLHVVEKGHARESSYYCELTNLNSNEMVGTFGSMVADSSGIVKWKREPFKD